MTVPSLNFKFLIKQKRKFKWVSLSFFSQTGTYSLTALVYHDESLQGIKKLYTYIYFAWYKTIEQNGIYRSCS